MAKIPYSAPTSSEGVYWFVRCVQKTIFARQLLYKCVRMCGDENLAAGIIVEKLRRGTWQLKGWEWASNTYNSETSVILREEVDGNWVMVKQIPGKEPIQTNTFQKISSATESNETIKLFFESLLYTSACLQYAIDQYVYSLYGINTEFQLALEEELKLNLFEISNKYPRLINDDNMLETKGTVPMWGNTLIDEAEISIENGQKLLMKWQKNSGAVSIC